MNEVPTPRRRRKRRVDDDSATVSVTPSIKLSPSDSIELAPDEMSIEVEASTSSANSKLAIIDRIRTELLEDRYHSQLVDPEYWDESHNWANNGESVRARLLALSWKI